MRLFRSLIFALVALRTCAFLYLTLFLPRKLIRLAEPPFSEPGLLKDYDQFLERLAPHEADYQHNLTGEDNGDAHIKRQLMGREVVVAITNGRLDVGPWEQIFYGEFDGQRAKRVLVKIIGE